MAQEICSDDKERSIYLIQIQYLDEQLERCQFKRDELEKQNEELVSQYDALEKDECSEYLKRSLAAKQKKVEELVEQLESLQQATEQNAETLKLQRCQEIQELRDRVEELDSESATTAAKFEEQQGQKEQLMRRMRQLSNMESLKKQLVGQKEEHEAAVESLKEEAALERKRMVEQMESTVEKCVKMKTSNFLWEERAQHIRRAEQLLFLLEESVNLSNEIDALQGREGGIYAERDDLRDAFYKISLESFTRNKEVVQLNEECLKLEEELKDGDIANQHLLAQIEDLSQQLAAEAEQSLLNTAKAVQLEAELQEERNRRRKLQRCVQEAVIILRHILTVSEKESDTQWKMQRLLEILESTAPPGTDYAFKDSTEKSNPRTETTNH